jgi:hypothetical protein
LLFDSDILAHRGPDGSDFGSEASRGEVSPQADEAANFQGFFQILDSGAGSGQSSHAAGVALQIQYPEPWGILASRSKNSNWR